MNNHMRKMTIVLLFMFILFFIGCSNNNEANNPNSVKEIDCDYVNNNLDKIKPQGKLRICPDVKINNEMPGTRSPEYYVYNGSRINENDYDWAWIHCNCDIPVETVY